MHQGIATRSWLAAIDTRNQNFERAEAHYLKVLELDPRDAYAQAALIGLRGGGDAQQSESRLKTLISQQPDSTALSFTLGNQYASQQRWAEAQQAFFAAFSGDPENADYAYNLAISLDHLRQPRLALEYYQRALESPENRPVGFNTAKRQRGSATYSADRGSRSGSGRDERPGPSSTVEGENMREVQGGRRECWRVRIHALFVRRGSGAATCRADPLSLNSNEFPGICRRPSGISARS